MYCLKNYDEYINSPTDFDTYIGTNNISIEKAYDYLRKIFHETSLTKNFDINELISTNNYGFMVKNILKKK